MHGGSYGSVAKLVAEIRFSDEVPLKIRFSDDTNCKLMRRVIVPWPTVAARRSSSLDSGTNEKAPPLRGCHYLEYISIAYLSIPSSGSSHPLGKDPALRKAWSRHPGHLGRREGLR